MTIKKILPLQVYIKCIEHASSVLGLYLAEIKEKYRDYPLCCTNDQSKNICEKTIDIRFDKEEITLVCTFNEYKKCSTSILFADTNELIERFVDYLSENYNYNFVKSQFILENCYLRVRELKDHIDSFYFIIIYQ